MAQQKHQGRGSQQEGRMQQTSHGRSRQKIDHKNAQPKRSTYKDK